MRLMHTKLPDFIQKLKNAAKRRRSSVEVTVNGLEGVQTAKLASSSTGMSEEDIYNLTADEEIVKVEVNIMPQLPASLHTIIMRGVRADGTCKKVYLQTAYLSQPGPEYFYHDAEEVIDNRVSLD
ncbi:hypothetical protein AN644_01320 [Candidatus Epulonipiscium fishelsonii]|nr:hypothetical protein AN644_01320 [Epulopiscium sp. SCG-C06WGA-EpuloA1]